MKAAILLILLATPLRAQSTAPARSLLSDARLDAIDVSVKELQSGRPTITAAPTYIGTITFQNAGLAITTTTGSQGLTFQDGTAQYTSAAVAFASTTLAGNTTAINQTSMLAAVAGSTITLKTTRSSRHAILFNAVLRVTDAGATATCGVMQNGAWIEGQSASIGLWVFHAQGTPHFGTVGPPWYTRQAYAAGTYNYALACSISVAGSVQVCSNAVAASDANCYFEVREIP